MKTDLFHGKSGMGTMESKGLGNGYVRLKGVRSIYEKNGNI